MGIPKRYTVLGCKLNASAARWANQYKQQFLGLGNYPPDWSPQRVREDDIITCLGMLALHHLGYKIPVEPADWLDRGFDIVVDYFCGDWWQGHPDAVRAMDKARKRQELRWFNAFSIGLLLGLLSGRWEDVAAVCDWVDPSPKAEPLLMEIEEFEPDLPHVYLSVAARLRPTPMPGLATLEKRLRTSANPRPRLLFRAWEAARGGDQVVFGGAFVESLAYFAAVAGSGPTASHWVSLHHSVVGLAAQRLGLVLPQLPPKLDALVMTRTSLGLDVARRPKRADSAKKSSSPEISPEYVESLVEQFRASRPKTKEILARQVTFTLRGLMRAKAELVGEGKSLDRESAENWFIKSGNIRHIFSDHDQFIQCLDLALKIVQQLGQA